MVEQPHGHHAQAPIVVMVVVGLEAPGPQRSCVLLGLSMDPLDRHLAALEITPDRHLQRVQRIDVRVAQPR